MVDGTTWNILSNLGNMNIDRNIYAIGICGNDYLGNKAIETLKNSKVNTERIIKADKKTNIVYSIIPQGLNVDKKTFYTTVSPITNSENYSLSEKLPLDRLDDLKEEQAIIILENFRGENIKLIELFENKKVVMDIGRQKIFKKLKKEYIKNFLSKIDIIQISGEILEELMKRLEVNSVKQLYSIIEPEMIIVTNGKNKTLFTFKEKNSIIEIQKTPEVVNNVKDATGAGDSFFSVIINAYSRYIEQNKTIDKMFIEKVFPIAQSLSGEVIKQIGGRCDIETIEKWKKKIVEKEFIR